MRVAESRVVVDGGHESAYQAWNAQQSSFQGQETSKCAFSVVDKRRRLRFLEQAGFVPFTVEGQRRFEDVEGSPVVCRDAGLDVRPHAEILGREEIADHRIETVILPTRVGSENTEALIVSIWAFETGPITHQPKEVRRTLDAR